MTSKHYALLFALFLELLSAAAQADVIAAVNWARVRGCTSERAPLRDNARLQQAAQHLANGESLQSSLTSAGYLAAQSSVIHLSGAVNDDQLANILVNHYCTSLADPKLTELGVQRRGRDVWMVFAAPVALPGPGDADFIARQILDLVNRARSSGRRCGGVAYPAVPPLTLNPVLSGAALTHSQSMARYDEFDHRGHDGSSPATRVQRAGYGSYVIVGENIAAGAMTPAEVTEGWLQSPAHCENIMDGRFAEIGIAYAVNTGSSELVYWTQDFAGPPRPRRVGHTASSQGTGGR
jgi:uncharacterized protein YkwD